MSCDFLFKEARIRRLKSDDPTKWVTLLPEGQLFEMNFMLSFCMQQTILTRPLIYTTSMDQINLTFFWGSQGSILAQVFREPAGQTWRSIERDLERNL